VPTELDKLNEELMRLKKDRDRFDNSISALETRIKEIQNSDDPAHQPGYLSRKGVTHVENVDAWNNANSVMLQLRTIETRGELMPPEDLWKKPGYIIVCDGYLLDIWEVSSNSQIFPTLSPIFTSKELAQSKIDKLGKHVIIQAYRTLMFSADKWPTPGVTSVPTETTNNGKHF
jgi:hypothetical protein